MDNQNCIITDSLVNELLLVKQNNHSFYKEVKSTHGFNYCRILVTNKYYLSIKIGKNNTDYERQILKTFYVSDEKQVIDTIKRLPLLSIIFSKLFEDDTFYPFPYLNDLLKNVMILKSGFKKYP